MQTILDKALSEIPHIKVGTEFLVKDLFKGYEWNEMDIKIRRTLGRFFFEESQNPYLKNGVIVAIEKNAANQQMYKKIKDADKL